MLYLAFSYFLALSHWVVRSSLPDLFEVSCLVDTLIRQYLILRVGVRWAGLDMIWTLWRCSAAKVLVLGPFLGCNFSLLWMDDVTLVVVSFNKTDAVLSIVQTLMLFSIVKDSQMWRMGFSVVWIKWQFHSGIPMKTVTSQMPGSQQSFFKHFKKRSVDERVYV